MLPQESIDQYLQYVNAPWGKLYYRVLFHQLDKSIPGIRSNETCLKILDFGSGFGIVSNEFAATNEVMAIEPNKQMLINNGGLFQQVVGSLEEVANIEDSVFDCIFCHNVLEYVDLQEKYFSELIRVLKPNGFLSLVAHNFIGKIIATSVFNEDPLKAYNYLKGIEIAMSDKFGKLNYLDESMIDKLSNFNLCRKEQTFGIRVLWGIIANNDIKYDHKWNEDMYKLEIEISEIQPYKEIGFWKHYIIKKS